MAARINHIATNSGNPRAVGTMYETIFGMWFDEELNNPASGQVLHDGNIALNLQARAPGHRGGLDHFGIAVDNMDAVFDKLKSDYPHIEWVDRPKNCPFSGYFSHDPAGSIFALSKASDDKTGQERQVPINFLRWKDADSSGRYLHHYAIRTKRIEECADFYEDVFSFTHATGEGDDPNHYLSDGRVTLMLIPWHIADYEGISVTGRGPDHIGFKVEDADRLITEIRDSFSRYAPGQAPMWLFETINALSDEAQVMDGILDRACPMSRYHFTDKDGVFVVVGDKTFGEL